MIWLGNESCSSANVVSSNLMMLRHLICLYLYICQVWIQFARSARFTEESSGSFGRTTQGTFRADPGAACKVSYKLLHNIENNSLICAFHGLNVSSPPLFLLLRHSFEYLLNFGSTMPSLSTCLCLSQLLSTVSEKGGNPAAYREQTGRSDMLPHFYKTYLLSNGLWR